MKGFSFTFIIVFLTVTLLSLVALQKSMVSHKREDIYIRSRITDMNRMYDGIARDVNKAVDIIAKRSMSVIVNDVVSAGRGIDQADFRIEELMVNGTLNGTTKYLMENSTVPDWISTIEAVALLRGYDLEMKIEDLQVKPYDSWDILVTADMEINISELKGVANISRRVQLSKLVSVEDLEDPLYALSTLGRGTNIIERSYGDFTGFLTSGDGENGYEGGWAIVVGSSGATGVSDKGEKVLVTDNAFGLSAALLNQFKAVVTESNIPAGVTVPSIANASSTDGIENGTYILVDGMEGDVWDISNLHNHTAESKYYQSDEGPSFLDRLEGKYAIQGKYSSQTPNVIGLESFIDKKYIDDLSLPVKMEQTNIDYLYFSNSTVNGNAIKGLDAGFRMDDRSLLGSTRQEVYEVDDLVV